METKIVKVAVAKSLETTNLWSYRGHELKYDQANFNDSDLTKYFELVLLSLEDETIYSGDTVLDLKSKDLLTVDKISGGRIITKEFPNISINKNNLSKVIARQSQISPEDISKFVEKFNQKWCHNKDWKNVEIENVEIEMIRYPFFDSNFGKYFTKLTNKYVTIVEKPKFDIFNKDFVAGQNYAREQFEKQISYSEQELNPLFEECLNLIGYIDSPIGRKKYPEDVVEMVQNMKTWFENNKK